MTSERTPGNWVYDPERRMVETELPNLKDEFGHVCDLRPDLQGNVNDADGRLIAAAPELLAICQRVFGIKNAKRWTKAERDRSWKAIESEWHELSERIETK